MPDPIDGLRMIYSDLRAHQLGLWSGEEGMAAVTGTAAEVLLGAGGTLPSDEELRADYDDGSDGDA